MRPGMSVFQCFRFPYAELEKVDWLFLECTPTRRPSKSTFEMMRRACFVYHAKSSQNNNQINNNIKLVKYSVIL